MYFILPAIRNLLVKGEKIMAQLIPENVTRKLDNLGRITLPKGLRDRMYLSNDNDELEIFTAVIDGRNCICLASPVDMTTKLLAAAEVFAECGVELPKEMKKYIEGLKANKDA